LFRADKQTVGQTDMMRLIVAFGNFANAPKNGIGHSPLPRIYVGISKAQMTLYS